MTKIAQQGNTMFAVVVAIVIVVAVATSGGEVAIETWWKKNWFRSISRNLNWLFFSADIGGELAASPHVQTRACYLIVHRMTTEPSYMRLNRRSTCFIGRFRLFAFDIFTCLAHSFFLELIVSFGFC